MRVTAGSARGKPLLTLEGDSVRPTGDKVKQAVFSMLQFELYGRLTLDLFAGSGQLGIEALSRGAASCAFVDASADSIRIIEKNLERTGPWPAVTVSHTDFRRFLDTQHTPFDLVFLDPPYHHGTAVEALTLLLERGLLSGRAIAVCEVDGAETLPAEVGGLFLDKLKRYRFTAVGIYRKREESPIEDSSSSGQL